VLARGARVDEVNIFDDVIAIRGTSNTMTIMETDTGTNRWSAETGRPLDKVYGSARTSEGDLIVSTDTQLTIYDIKTGTLNERQRYAILAATAPVVSGRFICVGGANGQLLIHNLSSGYRQHAYDFGAPITVRPIAVGQNVGAVARNGKLFIINPSTGASVARTRVYAGIEAVPASGSDAMFVSCLDQSLWAFEANSGATRWRIRTSGPIKNPPIYHDETVYVSIPDEGLTAFDASTGEIIWVCKDVFADAVCLRGDRLIAWDGTHAFAIQNASGDVLERVTLPGVDRLIADRFDEGNLYTVSMRTGEVRKHSPIR